MAELLVNQYFQPEFIDNLSAKVHEVFPRWSDENYKSDIYNNDWEGKALKQRMQHISFCLKQGLPNAFPDSLDILKKVYPHFNGFEGMVFSDFVEQYGQDHLELSLSALELFTQHGSAEFAIRPFILRYEEVTMNRMRDWSKHPNFHVRRLASEGSRPRLPWAMALPNFKKNPGTVISILENLKDDPEEYVRKSVANHWNDISKDNPDLVLESLRKWSSSESKGTKWIIKHALRGLIKKGDSEALRILGFKKADIALVKFNVKTPEVALGNALDFEIEITNKGKEAAQVVVDYAVHFMKANGQQAPKVFKLKNLELNGGASQVITKTHGIKPISTRKYYGGEHKVTVQVNGEVLGEVDFELTT